VSASPSLRALAALCFAAGALWAATDEGWAQAGRAQAATPSSFEPIRAPRKAERKSTEAFGSSEAIARWINQYRLKPEPNRLPIAFKAMSALGVFKDGETSGLYLGFAAGVLASATAADAERLIAGFFPLPPEDHIAVVKAIAYSGRPDWQAMLRKFAERMPARAVVIDRYLTGKLPALAELALDAGPAPLDVLWGHYFATGNYEPVLRIVSILSWSKEGNKVERLTIGSMAKWTLASNAARDMDLLRQLKSALAQEPSANAAMLREVIDAAEIGEVGKIRKEALTAIETLKVKGSEAARNYAWWGQAGQTALALGCITASALGQAAVGVPCVIGGALSSAALKAFAPKE
jgi:hypothetical protein